MYLFRLNQFSKNSRFLWEIISYEELLKTFSNYDNNDKKNAEKCRDDEKKEEKVWI